MSYQEDLVILKQSDEIGTKKRTRRALGLALAVLLISISCGGMPSLVAPTPTETATALPAFTSTPVPPSISASATIPCRTGPEGLDELVVNLQPGEKADIIGKADGFWVVKTSDGSECWVADQGVTLEGEVATVPNAEPPPTPLPEVPTAPQGLHTISVYCSVDRSHKPFIYISTFNLEWNDMSNNEDGFRVYRDGDLVADLPADKTDVADAPTGRFYRIHYYYIAAYNSVGVSKGEAIALMCSKEGGGGSDGGGGGGGGGGVGP